MTNTTLHRAVRPLASQLSRPLIASALGLFGVGILAGGVEYLHRSPVHHEHSPGTAAWIPHLCLLAAGLAWLALARRAHRRRHPDRLLLLAPAGKAAAARLRLALVTPRYWPRVAVGLFPLVVLLYTPWRIGEQILAGLDPNWTVNAWGGPTYLGAMACHYLDGILMAAAAASLLHVLLPPTPRASTTGPDEQHLATPHSHR